MDPLRLLECWARLEKRIRRGASVAEQDKAFSSQGHVFPQTSGQFRADIERQALDGSI